MRGELALERPLKVLEVGAGNGALSQHLRAHLSPEHATVVGPEEVQARPQLESVESTTLLSKI